MNKATKVAHNIKKMENIFMNYLNYTYKILKEVGLVSNLNDYSSRYLLKCESYARSYRARGKDLTLASMIVLAARLDNTAKNLMTSNAGLVIAEDIKRLANEMAAAVYDKALALK